MIKHKLRSSLTVKAFFKKAQALFRKYDPNAYAKHFFLHTKWGKGILIAFGVWLLSAVVLVVQYQIRHADDPTELGVSFSTKYANELGVDWQANFLALVDDLDFEYLRLMSYWDLHEMEDDQFDFESLDWQMDQAAARGVKVNLAVGERQPRWPECHVPGWVDGTQDTDPEFFEAELLEYISVVVNRYKDHPALEQYQLENEAFNRVFTDCPLIEHERVVKERDLIKQLDPIHPVAINVSNQSGIPVREPVGDKVGFSMYQKAYGTVPGIPFDFYSNFWFVPPFWHTYRAALVELFHGTDTETFVHELQNEPWGREATVNLTIEEQEVSMTPEIMRSQVEFAESTGMSRIYLWGGEWWYWRMTEFNDDEPWETARDMLTERR